MMRENFKLLIISHRMVGHSFPGRLYVNSFLQFLLCQSVCLFVYVFVSPCSVARFV